MPFCKEMHRYLGGDFYFVATEPAAVEQLALGYTDLNSIFPFVCKSYEGDYQYAWAKELATEADVVVLGSAPLEFVSERLKQDKLTFFYAERLYKHPCKIWTWPLKLYQLWKRYGRYRNFYLLCASAYTAQDYSKTLTFINKSYKWGYFPEVKTYNNLEGLIKRKKPANIMWAGRFIDWKHPEFVIEVARRLKAEGYKFQINMLGNGVLFDYIKQLICDNKLEKEVNLLGAMSPIDVRMHMEQASIYLFTSDRNEGWGAVLNESMNSGCAVVASDDIGAVPFMLQNGYNGLVFHSGDVGDLYRNLKTLLDSPELCVQFGKNAYETITQHWNADIAAERLIQLSHLLLQGEKHPYPYSEGPCSKAI